MIRNKLSPIIADAQIHVKALTSEYQPDKSVHFITITAVHLDHIIIKYSYQTITTITNHIYL